MRRHAKNLVRIIKQQAEMGRGVEAGAEVGVWRGHTSHHLLRCFPALTLVMVDPWDLIDKGNQATQSVGDQAPRVLRKAKEEALELTQPYHDRRCVLQGASVEQAATFKDETFDFVFIDACHLYEDCKQDLNAWYSKVKPGGVFAGHDYNSKMDRKGHWGVKRAVDEFCKQNEYAPGFLGGNIWWIKKGDHKPFVDPVAPKEEAPEQATDDGW